jgi:hypothetical protein
MKKEDEKAARLKSQLWERLCTLRTHEVVHLIERAREGTKTSLRGIEQELQLTRGGAHLVARFAGDEEIPTREERVTQLEARVERELLYLRVLDAASLYVQHLNNIQWAEAFFASRRP